MSVSAPTREAISGAEYRHEALLYAGPDEFVASVVPFVRDGVAAGEPVLVVVSAAKIALLRAALGAEAERVLFADMDAVGGNPARIIPAWRDFLTENGGADTRVRGVGEPCHPGRRGAELTECHRHEALLNLAFADTPGFWLLCPYDTSALADDVIHEVARTHPFVLGTEGAGETNEHFVGADHIARPFDDPLSPPAGPFHAVAFDLGSLTDVRALVARQAAEAGLAAERAHELVLTMSELATNSVQHGGGVGILRTWCEDEWCICEVRDRGSITDPLAGRVAPCPTELSGRGLWLANQLCDLVQVRAFAGGGAVRVHVRRP